MRLNERFRAAQQAMIERIPAGQKVAQQPLEQAGTPVARKVYKFVTFN
jgi:hypothetical protein